MSTEPLSDSRTFVSAFARGLRVIETFGSDRTRMTLAEVAQRSGFDRAVTRRLLLTLVELGLAKTDGKQFELTPRVLRLGYSYLASVGLDERLRGDLDDLSIAVGEATSVGILDGSEVVLVARSEAAALPFIYAPRAGSRLPAFSSSSGRVLLASLPPEDVASRLAATRLRSFSRATRTEPAEVLEAVEEARSLGYAINVEELNEGVLSVSVPLLSRGGRVAAALSVSSHVGRLTPDSLVRDVLPPMRAAAARMSALLI